MRRLNLNNTATKKDTFGIKNCHGCPPYYDPLEVHDHLWKYASVINRSDPTFLQWEQDPKRPNVDNRKPINPDWQYCCVCHIARPPIFKMKENSIESMDRREISKLKEQLPEPEIDEECRVVSKILAKQEVPKKASPVKLLPVPAPCYSVQSHDDYMDSRQDKRATINQDIGEMIEPNNTSRSVMRGCSQNRPGLRRKVSIFLDKNRWADTIEQYEDDPMTMVIQEKSNAPEDREYLRSGKKIRVKLIENKVKMLEKR